MPDDDNEAADQFMSNDAANHTENFRPIEGSDFLIAYDGYRNCQLCYNFRARNCHHVTNCLYASGIMISSVSGWKAVIITRCSASARVIQYRHHSNV